MTRGDRGRVTIVAETVAPRLDRFLAQRLPAAIAPSRTVAARLVREGWVRVNGAPAKSSQPVDPGDVVTVEPGVAREAMGAEPEDLPLQVVYEDTDLMVIDKPAGMVVHPAAGHSSGTLVNALLARHAEWPRLGGEVRPGIVHRLDKGTSGLMLVARTDQSQRRLAADLAARRISRIYIAICHGVLREDVVIEGPIGRHPRDRKKMAVVEGGRAASTTVEVLERLRRATLVQVTLGSGRTHQVRVHLAAIGHPVVGDDTYGRGRTNEIIDRPALHAKILRFAHPGSGVQMEFSSQPPADFMAALMRLREESGSE